MPFQIVRNDITKMTADAIVNTANPEPIYASGTDAAIYRAAGADALLTERRRIGRIEPGTCAVTAAFALHAKYIIHTVGPVWQDGRHNEKETLASCYRNSLSKAAELGCESIAFPLISSGVYGFPKGMAIEVASTEIQNFLLRDENDLLVTLVVFDRKAYELSGKIYDEIDAFVDEHYVEQAHHAEYGAAPARLGREEKEGFFERRRRRAEEKASAKASAIPHRPSTKKSNRKPVVPEERYDSIEFNWMEDGAFGFDAKVPAAHEDTFQERLFALIDASGMTDVEVYKKANVTKKVFSTIRSNVDYQPKRTTAMGFILALRLDEAQARDLMARAGYAFSPASRFDLTVLACIEKKMYNVVDVNILLEERFGRCLTS